MTRLLSCWLALVGSVAYAVTDTIELQVPTHQVMPLLADRARASVTCLAPFTSGADRYFVDHVEFPGTPSIRRSATTRTIAVNELTSFSGHPVQVLLPVKTFLKKETTLENRSAAQNQYDLTPTSSLVFELSLRSGSQSERLCAELMAIEPVLPGGEGMLQSLKDSLGTQCFPLQLDGFDDLLDGRTQVSGRGLSASTDFSTLAFRLEFGNPVGDATAWRNFHEGALSALGRTGDDFAIGFDTELFARVLRQRFADNIGPPVTLTSGVKTAWLAGLPALTLWFDADVETDSCFNTIGAEPVSTWMMFSLGEGGTSVKLAGQTSTDLVDSDVLLCGAPFAGVVALLGAYLFPIVEGVIAGVAAGQGISGDDLPSECHSTGDDAFSCSFPLVLPSLDAGGQSLLHLDLKATSLVRQGTNLVIGGTTAQRGPLTYAPLVAIQTPVTLRHGVQGNCSSLHVGTEGRFIASGFGAVCKPMAFRDDPEHVFFSQDLNLVSTAPWERVVSLYPTAAFVAAPYTGTIIARTSGGARGVEVIAPAPMTQGEEESVLNQFVMAKANCMAKETGLFGIPGLFDPRWKIDPPYDLLSRVRSYDPALSRTTPHVRLDKVKFETVGRTTRPLGLAYSLPQQDVRITAQATIDFGGRTGKKTVAVYSVVRSTLRGEELGRTGIVTGEFPPGTRASFQVSSSTFPTGVSGVDFELDLSPGRLELQGTLNTN